MYELLISNDKGKTWEVQVALEQNYGNYNKLLELGEQGYNDINWKIVSVIYGN